MDFSLPDSLIAPCSALIGFLGLSQSNPTHRIIWDSFVVNRSLGDHHDQQGGGGGGRIPLRYVNMEVLEFPPMKPKRTSYEWYIPKGILKRNWMDKHLYKLPAVVVIFVELDWNDPNWSEKTVEVASKVKTIRTTLNGRGTKLAVVLIQKEAPLPSSAIDEDSERASSLCSACDLSARSLFVLPVSSVSVTGYTVRLENAFYDLSQNYYYQEIRSVKSHRDYLNKTTHLSLFVRHQFKAGFLNELKRDLNAAYKHYAQAYSLLMEVRATDTNIMEVKTVAGFINYKVCRLAFILNLPRDAISQFRKHAEIFRHKVGSDRLTFEHSGWLSKQYELFADIFDKAIRDGLPAVQTQHPGIYYQQAATHAINRRQQAEEAVDEESIDTQNVDVRLLEHQETLEFYGQRPWRPGKATLEPPDMDRENAAIRALVYYEKANIHHSQFIIELLRKAISQFEAFKSPRKEREEKKIELPYFYSTSIKFREIVIDVSISQKIIILNLIHFSIKKNGGMTAHLSVQIAEELRSDHQYEESLSLLEPVIESYRKENWSFLLNSVLSLSLKCAFIIASLPEYISLCLELGSSEIRHVSMDEKRRISSNLIKIFDGQCPSTEPGLTSKSERAAVGEALKLWVQRLDRNQFQIPPTIDLQKLSSSIVTVKVRYDSQFGLFAKADVPADISVFIVNGGTFFPVTIKRIELVINDRIFERNLSTSDFVVVQPSSTHKEVFTLRATQKDVESGKFSVSKVTVTVGGACEHVAVNLQKTFAKKQIPRNFFPKNDFFGNDVLLDETELPILQRDPLLQMEIVERSPILIGEWFEIKLKFLNAEESRIDDLKLKAVLIDSEDPIIGDTTTISIDPSTEDSNDEKEQEGEVQSPKMDETAIKAFTVERELGSAEKGSTLSCSFYVRASTTGCRNIGLRVSYSILEYRCALSKDLALSTAEPFAINTEFLSVRQRNVSRIYTDEPFLCAPEIRSLSLEPIRILNSRIEPRFPVEIMADDFSSESNLVDASMYKESVAKDCFCLMVKRSNLTNLLDVQDITVGKYVLEWRREDDDDDDDANTHRVVTSVFELSMTKLSLSSLFVQAELPPYGTVHSPFNLTYRLTNLTDKVQEYSLTVDPSESFMMSGNKQLHFKVIPNRSTSISYVLYPLDAGSRVPLPKLNLKSMRLAQGHDVNETLERLLPKSIAVLPRNRSQQLPKSENSAKSVFVES